MVAPAAAAVAVVAMMANVLPEQVEAHRAAGMGGHVGKPFDRAVLLATVARIVPAVDADREALVPPGLDETVYLATKRTLSLRRLRQVPGIFTTGLRSGFAGDVAAVDVRHGGRATGRKPGLGNDDQPPARPVS